MCLFSFSVRRRIDRTGIEPVGSVSVTHLSAYL
nr:MAG TPA: hypothetical protein [Caudoviricetes sp.]